MNHVSNRPASLDISEIDSAIDAAVSRVNQARELNKEECEQVNGGANKDKDLSSILSPTTFPNFPPGSTIGMIATQIDL